MNIPTKTKPKILVISELQDGQRIDNFLLKTLKGLPKSRIYRIVRKGEVRVNKKRIKPDYRVKTGDELRIPPMTLGAPTEASAPSASLQKLLIDRILFEDKALLIINKPSGIAVHGGSGISTGIIEALRAMRPQEPYLELAHRLDRETSGCLLLVKKPGTLKEIHELLRTGKVDKRYLALVRGHWPKHIRIVDAALKKFELQSGERMVNIDPTGKESVTEFRVIQRFADVTLVEAKPQTGRTHQIRVHATHMEHPLVGDDKYGDKDVNRRFRALGCKRLFLHASALSFIVPSTGQEIKVTAELDQDLEKLLTQIES